ncbi:hypothetical protein KJ903_03290 [Patescibacteria group bacterium]|nr:hypothetical protein [Patescibacteria group bacterium]
MDSVERSLQQSGLSDKEAKVYVASLELGSALASEIAKKSGIKRATVYVVLDELIKKGLVGTTKKDKKLTFVPESPGKLLVGIEDRKRHLEETEANVKTVLPELKSLFERSGKVPRIRFYAGLEGIRQIIQEALEVGEDYCHIVPTKTYSQTMLNFAEGYVKRKATAGIHTRVILDKIPWSLEHVKHDQEENRESRFIPAEYDITTGVRIYGNRVALISYQNEIGVVIEDAEIAKMMQMFFEVLWNVSTPTEEAK